MRSSERGRTTSTVLTVSGAIDTEGAARLARLLAPDGMASTRLVVDMSEVTHLGRAGVAALAALGIRVTVGTPEENDAFLELFYDDCGIAQQLWLTVPDPNHAIARVDADLDAAGCASAANLQQIGKKLPFDSYDQLAALAALAAVPVIVIGGGRDQITPFEHSKRIAEEIPGAELLEFPEAGHMVLLELHDEVSKALARLVQEASSSDE